MRFAWRYDDAMPAGPACAAHAAVVAGQPSAAMAACACSRSKREALLMASACSFFSAARFSLHLRSPRGSDVHMCVHAYTWQACVCTHACVYELECLYLPAPVHSE